MTRSFSLTRREALAAAVAAALTGRAAAQQSARKPKAPPGLDPGGVAVAIVGNGINYLRPEIAARLARDGEGDLIGFDLGDNDARPIERVPPPSPTSPPGPHSSLTLLLLREAPAARLVIARRKPGDRDGLAKGVGFVGVTPARIVLLLPEGPSENWDLLKQAAAHFKRHLIVLPASEAMPAATGALGPNVLVVGPLASDGAGPSQAHADLLAGSVVEGTAAGAMVAATRVTALAARLAAGDPKLEGSALKMRLLALGQRAAGAPPTDPPSISEPHRLAK
jgi:hypothetical protein